MTRRSAVRASDSDREQVAERLREAAGEGRLHSEELEERLGAAFSARTYSQLHTLVADLPGNRGQGPLAPLWVRATLGMAGAVGVLAAAAMAAMLFACVAGASAAWLVLERVLSGGRTRRLARGADPPRLLR